MICAYHRESDGAHWHRSSRAWPGQSPCAFRVVRYSYDKHHPFGHLCPLPSAGASRVNRKNWFPLKVAPNFPV